MRSYKDVISKTVLNVEVDKENERVLLEIEDGKQSIEVLLDSVDGVAAAMNIMVKSLTSKELESMTDFMLKRAEG
jgi:hypothetical protein